MTQERTKWAWRLFVSMVGKKARSKHQAFHGRNCVEICSHHWAPSTPACIQNGCRAMPPCSCSATPTSPLAAASSRTTHLARGHCSENRVAFSASTPPIMARKHRSACCCLAAQRAEEGQGAGNPDQPTRDKVYNTANMHAAPVMPTTDCSWNHMHACLMWQTGQGAAEMVPHLRWPVRPAGRASGWTRATGGPSPGHPLAQPAPRRSHCGPQASATGGA